MGGTYGLLGYIFCDLLEHEYITSYVFFFSNLLTLVEDRLFFFGFAHSVISDRSGAKRDGGKDVRVTVSYSPLREALEHRWSGITRRQTKGMNPAAVFIILGGHGFFFRLGGAANNWTH